jgi:Ser/Thr protein kinase RdoA (MazF antagonist)
MTHPFDVLTPDTIIDAVEAAGYVSDARLLALNSYENRVYQVGIEDEEPLIVKFYRPGAGTRNSCTRNTPSAPNCSRPRSR